jgi:hypothetical protein
MPAMSDTGSAWHLVWCRLQSCKKKKKKTTSCFQNESVKMKLAEDSGGPLVQIREDLGRSKYKHWEEKQRDRQEKKVWAKDGIWEFSGCSD